MNRRKKFKEAQRVLAHLPKRADELNWEELVEIVDHIQVLRYADNDGKVWMPDSLDHTGSADFLEAVDSVLRGKGLGIADEFTGQEVKGVWSNGGYKPLKIYR